MSAMPIYMDSKNKSAYFFGRVVFDHHVKLHVHEIQQTVFKIGDVNLISHAYYFI